MKSKKILSVIILIITILGFSTISNAALESKAGQSPNYTSANNHFTSIRSMEKSGGTLGLNANIDGTTYLDSSRNGIDVHMNLSTEWGTVALLAVSDYGDYSKGKKDSGSQISATTGNITGVFGMINSRDYNGGNGNKLVAGILENASNSYTSVIYGADKRYYNEYTTESSEYHKGDAMYQTAGWHGSGYISYVSSNSAPIYERATWGYSMFSFLAASGQGGNYNYAMRSSRACIVCGEGL